MVVRRTVDLHPSAGAVRTSLVAGGGYRLQQLHPGTDRRAHVQIAVLLSAHLRQGGHNKTKSLESCSSIDSKRQNSCCHLANSIDFIKHVHGYQLTFFYNLPSVL